MVAGELAEMIVRGAVASAVEAGAEQSSLAGQCAPLSSGWRAARWLCASYGDSEGHCVGEHSGGLRGRG